MATKKEAAEKIPEIKAIMTAFPPVLLGSRALEIAEVPIYNQLIPPKTLRVCMFSTSNMFYAEREDFCEVYIEIYITSYATTPIKQAASTFIVYAVRLLKKLRNGAH